MATTRLRKAFKYPEEDDSEGHTEGIDEEEQDKLIASLSAHDTAQTTFYTRLFTLLPILTSLYYIPTLASQPTVTTFAHALVSVLSLALSTFVLLFVQPSFNVLVATRNVVADVHPWRVDPIQEIRLMKSGRERHNKRVQLGIMALNALVCGLLAWFACASRYRMENGHVPIGGLLPGVVYVLILIARVALRPVDMTELENSRYRYKGA